MITAYVSDWSVVFYCNGEANSRHILHSIYDAALANGIGAGTVGVFDEPDEGTLVHVDLMLCDREEAIQILAKAGIPAEQVTFAEVVHVKGDEKKASQRNRRKRLNV